MTDWPDVVHDPVRGLTYAFDVAPDLTVCRTRITVDSVAFSPQHVHPHQVETFEVVSGRIRFSIDGQTLIGGSGAVFVIPANTAHAFVNDSGEPAEMIAEHRPAMRHREAITTFAVLSRERYVSKRFFPRSWKGLLQIAVSAMEFEQDVRFARPPWRVQRAVLRPLAKLGSRRGLAPILR